MPIFELHENSVNFPHPSYANPDGLLAVGGDLSSKRLLEAYRVGIFPWFNPGEEILWWSPNPRFVLFPEELKIARSMRPYFNQKKFLVTYDTRFLDVILNCKFGETRKEKGTWITTDIVDAYYQLHKDGFAHSVEVWQEDELVGGLYGLSLGRMFFGESMFTRVSNASKFGFISIVQALRQKGFDLIDCQMETSHLASLGARAIPRTDFLARLAENEHFETQVGPWTDWL